MPSPQLLAYQARAAHQRPINYSPTVQRAKEIQAMRALLHEPEPHPYAWLVPLIGPAAFLAAVLFWVVT